MVTNVRPLAFPPAKMISGDRPYNMQQGVMIGGPTDGPGKGLPYLAGAVTGPVSIVDNDFDLAGPAPTSTVAQAVFVAYTTGIDADIARNRIRNVARNAVEVIDNYRGPDGRGRVRVRDNDIATPLAGTPMPTPRTPNGIAVGYFLDASAAADEKRAMPHEVTGNRVEVRGQAAIGAGIALLMDGAVVVGNRITLHAANAVGISVAGSRNRVLRNHVDGSGLMGVVVAPGGPFKGSHNEVADNEFAQLKTSTGDVMLMKGSSGNRVAGGSGTVNDAGEGNATSGLRKAALK